MKFALVAFLAGSASAFAPSSQQRAGSALNVAFTRPSEALPGKLAPATLDGSLVGDAGFDPIGFTTAPWSTFAAESLGVDPATIDTVKWLREAELTHGRIAQLAVLGFIWPAAFGTFAGNEWTGVDAYSYTNPLEELDHVPYLAVAQIVAAMAWVEFRRVSFIKEDGKKRIPGDLRLGTPGGYNPFNLNYSPAEYKEKELQEIKHCRLAMMGVFGLFCQNANSGTDVISQLSKAIVAPEYAAKAGYFLPEGI